MPCDRAPARRAGVDLRTYRVIYDLVDDMRAAMEGRLGIVDERTPVGGADVRAVFGSGSKRVAGVMVTDGAVRKGCLGQVRPRLFAGGPTYLSASVHRAPATFAV